MSYYPATNFNFRVTFGPATSENKGAVGETLGATTGFPAVATTQWQKVTGLDLKVEDINYREGTDSHPIRKLPGKFNVDGITLSRGVTSQSEMLFLLNAARIGQNYLVDVTVETMALDKSTAVRTISYKDCWVGTIKEEELNAQGNEIHINQMLLHINKLGNITSAVLGNTVNFADNQGNG